MRKPAFKVGEKINWSKPGETQIQEGIIDLAVTWQSTFTYLIRDHEPHLWVREDEIIGSQERRALRDKLDGLQTGVTKPKTTT